MANNRIYLKCNVCGETLFLGKSFLQGYYWANYGKLDGDPDSPPLEDRLNEFFAKHAYCNNKGNDGDYSIEYESPVRDTVEVVRCRDCKWYEIYQLKQDGTDDHRYNPSYCTLFRHRREPEWFCADGERREDER